MQLLVSRANASPAALMPRSDRANLSSP
jgi:hypothetical protein